MTYLYLTHVFVICAYVRSLLFGLAGTYCPSESAFPVPCPAGTWTTAYGQVSDKACISCNALSVTVRRLFQQRVFVCVCVVCMTVLQCCVFSFLWYVFVQALLLSQVLIFAILVIWNPDILSLMSHTAESLGTGHPHQSQGPVHAMSIWNFLGLSRRQHLLLCRHGSSARLQYELHGTMLLVFARLRVQVQHTWATAA
jgi:hypothetical protein